jgi:hypothetical protein
VNTGKLQEQKHMEKVKATKNDIVEVCMILRECGLERPARALEEMPEVHAENLIGAAFRLFQARARKGSPWSQHPRLLQEKRLAIQVPDATANDKDLAEKLNYFVAITYPIDDARRLIDFSKLRVVRKPGNRVSFEGSKPQQEIVDGITSEYYSTPRTRPATAEDLARLLNKHVPLVCHHLPAHQRPKFSENTIRSWENSGCADGRMPRAEFIAVVEHFFRCDFALLMSRGRDYSAEMRAKKRFEAVNGDIGVQLGFNTAILSPKAPVATEETTEMPVDNTVCDTIREPIPATEDHENVASC